MEQENFDLIIVGGGPAGYVAALRAAQLGLKTVCIEKRKTLGGTCLNVGCIPSKALLSSSEHYHFIKTKLQKHGITVGEIKLDVGQMMKRKESVVRQLTGGIGMLFKRNKIEWALGEGTFKGVSGDQKIVEVQTEKGPRTFSASKVLIATGSEPSGLPFLPFDGKRIISSTEALSLPQVPQHLVVVGGGVIGLELGSVWLRLGAKVTVIEFQNRILPGMDQQASAELYKMLLKQGMEFHLASKCLGAKDTGAGVVIDAEELEGGKRFSLECDTVLVATGRKPFTQNLGLDAIGIKTNKYGRIDVDQKYQTSVAGVYAAGDVIAGPMLAHKASEEGVAVVENIAGQHGHVNYDAIPGVVYTWPEFASVGATEEELKTKGIEYKLGSFPFLANGRAKAMEETEGFVKVLADTKTDKILGVHIVGAQASELIAEATAYMECNGSSNEMARTCHAHPTLAEIVKEAALAVNKRQLHI